MLSGDQHLFELGQEREPWAILRWLTVNGNCFFPNLGISGPWWCGINILKSQIFDDIFNGDIDIIAGNLNSNRDYADWLAEGNRVGSLLTHPVAACEVKVSWFHPDDATWKNTHTREVQSIKGSLKELRQRGFNSVSFLHLGVTRPRTIDGINPWFLAMSDAQDAHASLPVLFDPLEIPCCGYFTAVTGAIEHKTEAFAGAGGIPFIRQAPEFQSEVGVNGTWRLRLQRRLVAFSPPGIDKIFVLVCRNCKSWFAIHDALPSIACPQCQELWNEAH